MTELLIINPNTSTEVSAAVDDLARQELGSTARIRTVTAAFGARYIASRTGVAIGAHAALDAYASALSDGARPDVVVLACFGDPGLDALREISPVPVLGFADSGLTAAVALPGSFAIATIGPVWGEMLGELIARRGLAARFAGMITLDEDSRVDAVAIRNIEVAAAANGATRVIVGGTGLIPIMPAISAALPSLVLDPHRLTLRLAATTAPGVHSSVAADAAFVGLAPALQALLNRPR